MNRDVFLSLLALDAYNRGYGQNVLLYPGDSTTDQDEAERTIGSATVLNVDLPAGSIDAGFYAIAYEWGGETIISYRGTNVPGDPADIGELINDFGGGWEIFTWIGSGSHARFARDFYVSVTGHDFVSSDTDPIATGVTLNSGDRNSGDSIPIQFRGQYTYLTQPRPVASSSPWPGSPASSFPASHIM